MLSSLPTPFVVLLCALLGMMACSGAADDPTPSIPRDTTATSTETGTLPPTDDTASPPGALWDACDDTHPCGDGLVCDRDDNGNEGVCRGDAGAACEDDAGCADSRGYACVPVASYEEEQVCGALAGSGEPCFEDEDCRTGQCGEASETCAAALGSSCLSNEDCLSPGVCRYDETGARTCQLEGGLGDYCDASSDCADGRTCRSGTCLAFSGEAGCADDAVCPDGTVCRDDGDGTTACLEPAESAGAICLEATDCSAELVCVEGVCLSPEGAECVDATDCSDGNVCYSGYCTAPVAEGASCQDASGEPEDTICADGMLCSAATLTCTVPYSGVAGDACAADEECGTDDDGNTLVCNGYTDTCAIAGPAIHDFAASDVVTATADGDDWGDWTCVAYPEVDVPDGYATWTFVDTVSHETYGEDVAGFQIVLDDATGQACATAKGQRDGWWPFGSDGPPSVVEFRVNTLVYNPSLIEITSYGDRADDCPELPSGLPEEMSVDAPCRTETEYYYPVTLPEGFEGIGLVELQGYLGGADYGGFVHTVVSVSEMAISDDYVGIAVDRTLLFAGSYDSLCGGYVGIRADTVAWRTGLPVEASAGRYHLRQPGGAVTQDLTALGDADGVHLSFFGVQSSNLDTSRIQDDEFWEWCGSFSESGVTCDLEPSDEESEAFPYENEIESILTSAAEDGAVDLCSTLGGGDLCDVVGLGVREIAELIYDALFPDECGTGQDKDADWELSKEQSGEGWIYTYDATTGEDDDNDDVGITVQILDLNVGD